MQSLSSLPSTQFGMPSHNLLRSKQTPSLKHLQIRENIIIKYKKEFSMNEKSIVTYLNLPRAQPELGQSFSSSLPAQSGKPSHT